MYYFFNNSEPIVTEESKNIIPIKSPIYSPISSLINSPKPSLDNFSPKSPSNNPSPKIILNNLSPKAPLNNSKTPLNNSSPNKFISVNSSDSDSDKEKKRINNIKSAPNLNYNDTSKDFIPITKDNNNQLSPINSFIIQPPDEIEEIKLNPLNDSIIPLPPPTPPPQYSFKNSLNQRSISEIVTKKELDNIKNSPIIQTNIIDSSSILPPLNISTDIKNVSPNKNQSTISKLPSITSSSKNIEPEIVQSHPKAQRRFVSLLDSNEIVLKYINLE